MKVESVVTDALSCAICVFMRLHAARFGRTFRPEPIEPNVRPQYQALCPVPDTGWTLRSAQPSLGFSGLTARLDWPLRCPTRRYGRRPARERGLRGDRLSHRGIPVCSRSSERCWQGVDCPIQAGVGCHPSLIGVSSPGACSNAPRDTMSR